MTTIGAIGVALGVNTALGLTAWALGWVGRSAIVPGLITGTTIYLGTGWRGWLLLVTFFVIGSLATRWRFSTKAARGLAQRRDGRRGAREACANGAVAVILAVVHGLQPHPVWAWAYAGAFAAAVADTTSSEIGSVAARRAHSPVTLRPVPVGVEGAISPVGTLAGVIAALGLATVAVATNFLPAAALWWLPIAAALANHLESVVGFIVRRGWLADNEVLNLGNTLAGAALAGSFAWWVERGA